MKDIFIISNGPSARKIDLHKLKNTHVSLACVNYWPEAYKDTFFELKPEYLFLLDNIFYLSKEKVDSVNENVNKLRSIIEMVDWNLTIVIQRGAHFELENENVNFDFINQNCIMKRKMSSFYYFLMDKNRINPGYHNVVIGAVYYFLMKNNKRIFLVGTDISDFKNLNVDRDNRVYIESIHSYGKSSKFYYDSYDGYGITAIADWLNCWVLMLKEFEKMALYAKYKGAKIYNLSEESMVDCFEKISWEEYLSEEYN